ncbi:MFS transporter [Pseudovibrio sp. Tun.PSC04-5.I4]|uniref:MFS transporter n=1 Tax=Pseudovibrio sp. Tun.PSC04-5.I4 TaxID=1798213 RepID=UPI001AD8EBB8|nr:MFS transporter [Pseudovibrio sp. Tun.PSC04-5.I4]
MASAWPVSQSVIGLIPLLLITTLIFLLGIASTLTLPNTLPKQTTPKTSVIREVSEGIKLTFASPHMRNPVLLMSSAGLLLGGPYAVLVPIILRDSHNATGFDFAAAFATFMVGGAISSGILLKIGKVQNPMLLLTLGYALGGIALVTWSFSPPYWFFLTTILLWGFGGGICLNMSRAILQEHAPLTHKSRILSVMYMGDEGGAPLGSLLIGVLVASIGIAQAAMLPGVLVLVISAILLTKTTKASAQQTN